MKIGIIACGAIVREMIAIANRQEWNYKLTAVPAQLHSQPQKIAPAVEKRLDEWAEKFDLILVGYADCGTMGELDALVDRYTHVERVPGPHCYEFFGGNAFKQQADEHPGTFYLTDFLAHHFDALVWKELGLERYPELQEMYFGNYTHMMYIKQLPNRAEGVRAKMAADKLGLQYKSINTGLDELEQRLIQIVQRHKEPKYAII